MGSARLQTQSLKDWALPSPVLAHALVVLFLMDSHIKVRTEAVHWRELCAWLYRRSFLLQCWAYNRLQDEPNILSLKGKGEGKTTWARLIIHLLFSLEHILFLLLCSNGDRWWWELMLILCGRLQDAAVAPHRMMSVLISEPWTSPQAGLTWTLILSFFL